MGLSAISAKLPKVRVEATIFLMQSRTMSENLNTPPLLPRTFHKLIINLNFWGITLNCIKILKNT